MIIEEMLAEQLAEIIGDYRKGELPIALDKSHVIRWISQFPEESQRVILEETLYVFRQWFFDAKQIRMYLSEVYDYVCKCYGKHGDVVFFNDQQEGLSQKALVNELQNMGKIMNENSQHSLEKHLVYIDDGLYSGQHIIKDIKYILEKDSSNICSIDVFVMVGYSAGFQYAKSILEPICTKKGIQFQIYEWKKLLNDRTIHYSNNSEEYKSCQDTLWPLAPTVQQSDDPKIMIEKITNQHLHYCYREYSRHYKSRIFSNENNRKIVENEFLKAGMKILSPESIKKGIYPLGFSAYPSLGFGSFCASIMNISNTCPIVLWWGNLQKDGSELDKWYPLLPRRIN